MLHFIAMAENPFGPFPQGPAKPNVPPVAPPPAPEIKIRSMASDTKSISGGAATPIPESVMMPEENEPVFRPETQVRIPAPPARFGGLVSPASPATPATTLEEEPAPQKKKSLVVIIGIVIVLGLGLLGYFVVYPLIFGGEENVVVAPPPPPPPPPPVPHQSLFLSAPDLRVEVLLESVNFVTIANSLQSLDLGTVTDPVLQEVVVLDDRKNQIPWSNYLSELLPEFTKEELGGVFTDDFTAWVYHDSKGRWPGYAVRIVKSDEAATLIKKLETANLSPLYLTPSGTLGEFKDGALSGQTVRYALGGTPGAAFEYGIIRGDILIVSTSYGGLKEGGRLLGI